MKLYIFCLVEFAVVINKLLFLILVK